MPRRPRRTVVRVTGAALVLLLTIASIAVPAQAATVTVGATWSQLMRRKLNLEADSARLSAALPGLRATATTRVADLAQVQQLAATAAAKLAGATTAEQSARSRYAAARTAATIAGKAVTAARKHRPLSNSRITTAKRALTAANTTVQARAATVTRAASAVGAAQTAYAATTARVAAAETAYQAASGAVSDARLKITSAPALISALAARTAAISGQVVTETRGSFTTAQTVQVYGVTVNKTVAYAFQRMIDDAARAGVALSGGGFRTRQQQIALRTSNRCPDVWTAPASSCKVPTAIPGRSLHELGLAIDMTSGRKTVNDRRSAAFQWLAANAGRYGFVNLPSEPWHWSITGG